MFFFAFPKGFSYKHDPAPITGLIVIAGLAVFALSAPMRAMGPDLSRFRFTAEWLLWLNGSLMRAGLIPTFFCVYLSWLFGTILEDQLPWWGYAPLWAAGAGAGYLAGGLAPAGPASALDARLNAAYLCGLALLIGFFAIRNRAVKLEIAYFLWFLTYAKYDSVEVPGWTGFAVAAAMVGSLIPLSMLLGFPPPAVLPALGLLVAGAGAALATGQWAAGAREAAAASASSYYRVGLTDQAEWHAAQSGPQTTAERAQRALAALLVDSRDFALRSKVAQCVDELMAEGLQAEAARTWAAAERCAPGSVSLDAETLHTLATAAESSGDLTTAAELYFTVNRDHRTSMRGEHALFRLAHLYLALERPDDARQTWQAFRQLYPDSAWRNQGNPRLSEGA